MLMASPPALSLHPLPRHEDGTVRFWDASGVSLKPLYKLGTANIFQTDCEHNDSLNQAGEEEWPPFRKVMSPGLGGAHTPCCSPQHPPACLLGGMCLWEPSQLHCGDVSPCSGHSCCLSDTRDTCSALPDPWVCPGLGGGPWGTGDAWGWSCSERGAQCCPLSRGCVTHLSLLPQVGCFDPYSDDPRLGIQKIALCKYTAKMVVAGTAGQVATGGHGDTGCPKSVQPSPKRAPIHWFTLQPVHGDPPCPPPAPFLLPAGAGDGAE